MFTNINTIQKEYIGFSQFIKKYKRVKKISIILFVLLISILAVFSFCNIFINNNYYKDLIVADFRTDVNKLWEVSKIIESKRINNLDCNLYKFGTTGKILASDEINLNLKKVFISIADNDGNNKLSDNEIQSLGIMRLDGDIYSKELEILQFNSLSMDNKLEHYVIITKGKFTGTILYNGYLKFIDSNKRRYFGVEFFQQL